MINVCYIVLHSPYLLTQLVSRSAYKCPVTSCAKSFIVRSNAKHHTNACRSFGSTCRGCFNFWSRFFVSAHRQGHSARSSQTLLATSFRSYLIRQRSSPLSPKRSRIRPRRSLLLPAVLAGTHSCARRFLRNIGLRVLRKNYHILTGSRPCGYSTQPCGEENRHRDRCSYSENHSIHVPYE